MSLTYLVSAHCGGYYLSHDDPDDIERICETCGDSDRIVAEFDDDDTKNAATEILDYFADDVVLDEFDILTSCRSVDEMRSDIETAFSTNGLNGIINEIGLDSGDPIAAAMFNLNPKKSYMNVLDDMLDNCGVSFDDKQGDTAKQEAAVLDIARSFNDEEFIDNLRHIACFRLSGKQRRIIENHVHLTADDLHDISHSYENSCLHDGLVAAARHYL